jgi:hypothetical protein
MFVAQPDVLVHLWSRSGRTAHLLDRYAANRGKIDSFSTSIQSLCDQKDKTVYRITSKLEGNTCTVVVSVSSSNGSPSTWISNGPSPFTTTDRAGRTVR